MRCGREEQARRHDESVRCPCSGDERRQGERMDLLEAETLLQHDGQEQQACGSEPEGGDVIGREVLDERQAGQDEPARPDQDG